MHVNEWPIQVASKHERTASTGQVNNQVSSIKELLVIYADADIILHKKRSAESFAVWPAGSAFGISRWL
jgi:hypothetical protein